MGVGGDKVVNDIFFFGGEADHALAAARLGAESIGRQAFDIAVAGGHDNGRFIGDQVLHREFFDAATDDFGAAVFAEFFRDCFGFCFYHGQNLFWTVQELF